MSAESNQQRSRLTLRVSRDNGRSFGPAVTYDLRTDRPADAPLRFPPCSCSSCRKATQ